MMWESMNWGGWGMGFGMIIPLAVLGLIVWGVVTLTRASAGKGGGDALSILKARYAKGELTQEEFKTMRGEVA